MSRFAIRQDRLIREIKDLYEHKRAEICRRLDEFKEMWQAGTEEQIFCELVFCILTPMARGAMCSKAVENMTRTGVLFRGCCAQIAQELTELVLEPIGGTWKKGEILGMTVDSDDSEVIGLQEKAEAAFQELLFMEPNEVASPE